MSTNIIIYILLAFLIAINIVALVKRRKGEIVEHPNNEFLSPMLRFSNLLLLINVCFTSVSVIINACNLISFDIYQILMFISLGLIAISSVVGSISVLLVLYNIRKKGKMQEFAENRRGRFRLILQLLLFVFGITWITGDFFMISFNWFDVFLRLITYTPLQEIPVPGITYCILLYLTGLSPLYDMFSFNLHRKKS